jgi:hypothetical protein
VRLLYIIVALHGALWLNGCLDPSRLNSSCAWTGDTTSAALDIAVAAERRHLVNDVRIAGENATRYRDSVRAHLGFGVGESLNVECLDRLYATIGTQHGVRRAALDAAARMRDAGLDVALIYLPIGIAFLFVSSRISRRHFRRIPPAGERWSALLGIAWLGLGASAAATAVAHMHSWNVDTIRLRDFHMSFRVAYLPIGRHPWLALLAAMTVFAVAAVYEYRAARKRPAVDSRGTLLGGWLDR